MIITYPHVPFGKGNSNEKSFTSKWSEMDSLNTKDNLKQNWRKRKKKSPVKDFLKFFFDMEKKDKIGYHICRNAKMAKTKSYRNQPKIISHSSQ